MNAFYEMQLGFLAQLGHPDSPDFRQMSTGSYTKRSEFLSALCALLETRVQRLWLTELAVDKLERLMLAQLLKVAKCDENFISQGKGDRVIDVACGNLGWYRKLRSKAHDGNERPLLSATEMGLDTHL
ncbi:uncharacterized protein FFB20_12766 [Fusarium fujikuroi]|nr:uncharacterized protein FFB20_12766 [Fusarium fujikuroi]VTT74789.1 unnamed protein product [Fusarium fujikuroi]VZI00280.1 unnamed protein product [Fusarium fujikuroi]